MWLLWFLVGMNLLAAALFGVDKLLAVRKRRRIPESTLLLVSVLGGAFGAALGMILFHHKISKPKFRYTIPALFLFYVFAVFMIIKEVIL